MGGADMYRIGIDLGGTNIVAGLVDENMNIVDRISVKTNVPRSIESLTDDMARMVWTLMARRGLTEADVTAVGVGVPCTANESNGHMEDALNLGFYDVPLLPLMEEKLGLPVLFGNDANAAAWGEYKTGGYEEDSFIMVTLGTGIGGGVILNGKLWTGVNYAAAEFGHMTIRFDGEPCNCGRKGCLEAYASANALIRQAREKMAAEPGTLLWSLCEGEPERIEAKSVFDGAALGDKACKELLDTYTTYLAEGLANIINIFQPAYICIGGGVSKAGDALLQPLREKTARKIYSQNSQINTRIILAKLDNDAGVIGAALLEHPERIG